MTEPSAQLIFESTKVCIAGLALAFGDMTQHVPKQHPVEHATLMLLDEFEKLLNAIEKLERKFK